MTVVGVYLDLKPSCITCVTSNVNNDCFSVLEKVVSYFLGKVDTPLYDKEDREIYD